MTAIAKRKSRLKFETSATVQGRRLIVEAGEYTMSVREKGRHVGYEISYDAVFWLAVKVATDRKRAERRRKSKRG